MRKIGFRLSLTLVAMACLWLNALPAHAQAVRTWVSGTGDDLFPCSRTQPCKTFAGAISQTAAGGTINCLDPGGFGSVTITQSVTIDCTQTLGAILASSGLSGITVNAGVIVRLRGLAIEGTGVGNFGVNVIQAGVVRIDQCRIYDFPHGGITYNVPTGVGSELYVSDSVISENGGTGVESGIGVSAAGTGSARVSLSNVKLDNNRHGLNVSAPVGGTGRISLSLRDSTATGNSQTGITIASQGAPVVAALDNVTTTANATGLLADGSPTRVLITRLTAIANFTGLSTVNSGVIVSYGDNHINNNISVNGTPTVAQTPQ